MLSALFGSKSVESILLFLFVNGSCYGTQLHKVLNRSLTPLQKALFKLEKEGIIIGDFEGHTRRFQLNPAHPLLDEIQLLLQRAYTLLSAEEKRSYYVPKQENSPYKHARATKQKLVQHFWQKLCAVKRVAFCAVAKSKNGWSGKGQGDVLVTQQEKNVVIFSEKGSWHAKKAGDVNFSNTLRWRLHENETAISLEHLRHGWDDPVFLFDLVPFGKKTIISKLTHTCGEDEYFGHLFHDEPSVRLYWRVIGPKKNEEIEYFYS